MRDALDDERQGRSASFDRRWRHLDRLDHGPGLPDDAVRDQMASGPPQRHAAGSRVNRDGCRLPAEPDGYHQCAGRREVGIEYWFRRSRRELLTGRGANTPEVVGWRWGLNVRTFVTRKTLAMRWSRNTTNLRGLISI